MHVHSPQRDIRLLSLGPFSPGKHSHYDAPKRSSAINIVRVDGRERSVHKAGGSPPMSYALLVRHDHIAKEIGVPGWCAAGTRRTSRTGCAATVAPIDHDTADVATGNLTLAKSKSYPVLRCPLGPDASLRISLPSTVLNQSPHAAASKGPPSASISVSAKSVRESSPAVEQKTWRYAPTQANAESMVICSFESKL